MKIGNAPDTQIGHARERYDGGYKYPPADLERMRKVIRLIGSGRKVLDVGSYDGQLSKLIMDAGNDVIAMDASEDALKAAARRSLQTVMCDVSSRWPVESAYFDAVFAGEIIEHIIDTDFFLQECARVMRPGGVLVISTPNMASLGRRILLLLGLNPMIDTALRKDQAGHVRYFTRGSLSGLLSENGFTVDEVCSDVINFTNGGLSSSVLAGLFPAFGRSIIVRATRRSLGAIRNVEAE